MAKLDSVPSNLRRRVVANRKEKPSPSATDDHPPTSVESSRRTSHHGNTFKIKSISSIWQRYARFKSQVSSSKNISNQLSCRDIDTIVFSMVLCASGAFLALSLWKPSNPGFWNNLSQTCFYMLTTYFSLWSSSRIKRNETSGSRESKIICQLFFYCGVMCCSLPRCIIF